MQANKFFQLTDRAKVFKFEIPTDVAFGFLDVDIISTFSMLIDSASKVDLLDVDANILSYNKNKWPEELLPLKKLIKLSRILSSLGPSDSLDTPYQFIKTPTGYFIHPGSTRSFVSFYLKPTATINGIYLWYEDLDPTPLMSNYSWEEILDADAFTNMFNFDKYYFKCRHRVLTHTTDTTPVVMQPLKEAHRCFKRMRKQFRYTFFTYADYHDIRMDKDWGTTKITDVLKFVDQDTCIFCNIKLIKKNNLWLKA
jgi:hypothetical protein